MSHNFNSNLVVRADILQQFICIYYYFVCACGFDIVFITLWAGIMTGYELDGPGIRSQ
jgi:hypothetical protein